MFSVRNGVTLGTATFSRLRGQPSRAFGLPRAAGQAHFAAPPLPPRPAPLGSRLVLKHLRILRLPVRPVFIQHNTLPFTSRMLFISIMPPSLLRRGRGLRLLLPGNQGTACHFRQAEAAFARSALWWYFPISFSLLQSGTFLALTYLIESFRLIPFCAQLFVRAPSLPTHRGGAATSGSPSYTTFLLA